MSSLNCFCVRACLFFYTSSSNVLVNCLLVVLRTHFFVEFAAWSLPRDSHCTQIITIIISAVGVLVVFIGLVVVVVTNNNSNSSQHSPHFFDTASHTMVDESVQSASAAHVPPRALSGDREKGDWERKTERRYEWERKTGIKKRKCNGNGINTTKFVLHIYVSPMRINNTQRNTQWTGMQGLCFCFGKMVNKI